MMKNRQRAKGEVTKVSRSVVEGAGHEQVYLTLTAKLESGEEVVFDTTSDKATYAESGDLFEATFGGDKRTLVHSWDNVGELAKEATALVEYRAKLLVQAKSECVFCFRAVGGEHGPACLGSGEVVDMSEKLLDSWK